MTHNTKRRLVEVVLVTASLLFWFETSWPKGEPVAQKINCVNNLRMIGAGLTMWAYDHDGKYPFNVSTNAGGTLEFCASGSDGFDSNSARHFQVVTNAEQLPTPLLLVCPQDRSKKAATELRKLGPANVTYRLRTGTRIDLSHPKEVLAVCPIDGNTLYCDGTVVKGKNQ